MDRSEKTLKRLFDIIISIVGLVLICWVIVISACISRMETKKSGFFRQKRVGRNGKIFNVIKIRTMNSIEGWKTTSTSKNDPRITKSGGFFRKTKIDELPQLINVLIGDMSLVGPRPDVPGFADKLKGEDRIILSLRPGITGPASIHFRNEETLLAEQQDPESYNNQVIWPQKVVLNKRYIENWSFGRDLYYIYKTVFS